MKARLQETSVAEQAAQWVVEFDDPSEAPRLDEFAAWLKASPQNVEGFLSAAAAWGEFDGSKGLSGIDVKAMAIEAGKNVMALDPHPAPALSPSRVRSSGRKIALAAGLAAVAVGAVFVVNSVRQSTFSTQTGEQRTVKLTDGSVVYLNTHSRIKVRYSDNARELRLLEGEALFTVEKDPTRPFRVDAGGPMIQAVGTQFNVYRRTIGTKVSVIEGAVRISGNEIDAGEEADVTPEGAVTKSTATDIADAIAWRERRLIFKDTRLADIVAEFNRYNADYRLRLKDGNRGTVRLTGIFRADDPEALLLFLGANSDLTIEKSAAGAVIR